MAVRIKQILYWLVIYTMFSVAVSILLCIVGAAVFCFLSWIGVIFWVAFLAGIIVSAAAVTPLINYFARYVGYEKNEETN